MMLNIIAPYSKILYTIINPLNKITTTSSIHFAKTTILEFRVFENSKLCTTIRKTKKADKFEIEIRSSRLKSALFTGQVKKNEGIAILSLSSKNFVGESQFCLSVPKILWEESQFCVSQ